MSVVVVPTAYLPNLNYLSHIIKSDYFLIEQHEFFVKQTLRNRCDILSSSGAIRLSIPLVHQSDKEIINQKRISYAENWQHQHWRTITTAYKNSPYFEFFEHEFKPFYDQQFEFLLDYNTQMLKAILNILRIKKEIEFTSQFETSLNGKIDLRNFKELADSEKSGIKPYYQVFDSKLGFTPNLSCLDALFNIGLQTTEL